MKLIELQAIVILDKAQPNWIWCVFTVYIGSVVSGLVGLSQVDDIIGYGDIF